MGKITTEGRVTLEFEPELYEIMITVRAEEKSSGAATTAGKKQTEELLQLLQEELGIKPEQLSAEDETVQKEPHYRDSHEDYIFSRKLLLLIPADNKLREAVTARIAGMDNAAYSVEAKLTDNSRQKQLALDAAVQSAREKADSIAAALQSRVAGFEEILTDGVRKNEEPYRGAPASAAVFQAVNRAAELKNPKIKITGEVTVTWLTEPLT